MIYLNSQILIYINQLVIQKAHEHYLGVRNRNGLNLIIKQPQLYFPKLNFSPYPTVWLKGAYILQKLVKKHLFTDGNKRTAYIATKLFLMYNHYHLVVNKSLGVKLMENATQKSDTKDEMYQIAKFLQKHSKRFTFK